MRVFKDKKRAGRIAAFFCGLLVLFAIFSVVTETVLTKNDRMVPLRNKNIYRISREPENSVDVIVLGDSLSYSAFSPMTLWKEHGYASYVCGQSGQKLWEAEEMLRTALLTQTPKLVVLETHMMYYGGNIHGFDLNNSIDALLNYRVPLFRGHDVWKAFFIEKEYVEDNYKGFAFRVGIEPYKKGPYMIKTDKIDKLPDTTETHMRNIMELCAGCGADLLLVSTPSPDNCSYARHNALAAFAEEHDIPFVDMNLDLDTIGIDWETDSLDKGDHLNISGAEKATLALGDYLAAHYSLSDHRGEEAYSSWEKESAAYEKKLAKYLADIRGIRDGK